MLNTSSWPLKLFLALGRHSWWGALLWFLWVIPAHATELRIAIRNSANQVQIGASTTGVIRDNRGQAILQLPELQSISVDTNGGRLELTDGYSDFGQANTFWLEPSNDGVVWIGDRWYRGRVKLIPSNGGVTAINYVDIDDYLYSVVGSEMPASWPQEALRSQAVAARSYAMYHKSKANGQSYDLKSTQASQVYKGLEGEAASTQSAVDATHGKVLTHGGKVIEAVFHSSSGGHTENSEHVWSQAVPYLKGVPDFDQNAPVYSWRAQFSLEEVGARIGYPGIIQAVEVLSRSPQGRANRMSIIGDAGALTITGNTFRQKLGLRSTKFDLAVSPTSISVAGNGFGHGIGMSQWGARGMAERGQQYRDILTHFYNGTRLGSL
ncbi:SpoIID/LytB domain-containing protein [Leptolyngbyaceae cyanobacterium CCMR0082]|uniref:SpoIID/LytB domain-containing protein n=1 Tax=Adonisia turfae CCMR0082 TaxID=2304604 RepID=A0A6M0SAF3_9CYAN|nr:SpoIID/LytB domain-containing protein [Adonisia turfae]NEZ65479.1 SpoIID/LytB domain-containing protein [Adonisia turfae CCMR0082]